VSQRFLDRDAESRRSLPYAGGDEFDAEAGELAREIDETGLS